MSKKETPLIRKYWSQVGGTLIEEFQVVKRSSDSSPRYIDAIIIPSGEYKIAKSSKVSIEGKDIICVQAKHSRLGMYLMGQTLFSKELLQKFKPKSILSVALCTIDDSILRPLLESYPGMKVVVIQDPTNE